jgi:L-alanine-DL-glutamate epimerase-like enolase superfamily enzyme
MKIVRASWFPAAMPLEEPYAITYQYSDTAHNVFVVLETDTGIRGFGCSAPDADVTGETLEAATAAVKATLPALHGEDPSAWRSVMAHLEPTLGGCPSARWAFEMALLDVVGKKAGMPLWRLFGGARARILTSMTIGILPEQETIDRAKRWVRRGFRCLKLKTGRDWRADLLRVTRVREAVGPSIALRLDPNQGYSVAEAIEFARAAAPLGVEVYEQPTVVTDRAALAQVTAQSPLPVMADESLLGAPDLLEMVTARAVKQINVKLMKVGGYSRGQDLVALARTGGLAVMIGCYDESVLGIAAGLHFALAEGVQFADLDGHIGLQSDPATGGFTLVEGELVPNEAPGWGCDVREP